MSAVFTGARVLRRSCLYIFQALWNMNAKNDKQIVKHAESQMNMSVCFVFVFCFAVPLHSPAEGRLSDVTRTHRATTSVR